MKKLLSEAYCDALVELAFRLFPSMPEDDIVAVLDELMDLAAGEVARATAAVWDAGVDVTRACVERERRRQHERVHRPGPN